jgi:voltage-gated potassium channel
MQPIFVALTLVSAVINLGGACAFYLLEHKIQTKPLGALDAIYFAVTTTTGVGFGDLTPLSSGGKIVAMALMLLGTALFAAFTGTLAATLLELELKRRALHKET